MNRKWRLYLDTSVFGGCFDTTENWDVDSRRMIGMFAVGAAVLLTSEEVESELKDVPEHVRETYRSVPEEHREQVPITAEVEALAEAYMRAGVVGRRWWEDCVHVAAASVARADAIVSWNFKHIVRLDRIRAFNAVNVAEGYAMIQIISPKEVSFDE